MHGLGRAGRHPGEGRLQGCNVPQVVRRTHDQHRQIAFFQPGQSADPFPRFSVGPGVHPDSRHKIKRACTEMMLAQIFVPTAARLPPNGRNAVSIPGANAVRTPASSYSRSLTKAATMAASKAGLSAGKDIAAKPLGDKQRLVHSQLRSPEPVCRQSVAFVDIAVGLQKSQVIAETAARVDRWRRGFLGCWFLCAW